jgi:hypothetical protein
MEFYSWKPGRRDFLSKSSSSGIAWRVSSLSNPVLRVEEEIAV